MLCMSAPFCLFAGRPDRCPGMPDSVYGPGIVVDVVLVVVVGGGHDGTQLPYPQHVLTTQRSPTPQSVLAVHSVPHTASCMHSPHALSAVGKIKQSPPHEVNPLPHVPTQPTVDVVVELVVVVLDVVVVLVVVVGLQTFGQ